LFRGAKSGKFVAKVFSQFRQPPHDFGVGDVSASSSQQVVHTVYGCDCDVESIFNGLGRHQTAFEETPSLDFHA
jgi:hypothetical protein